MKVLVTGAAGLLGSHVAAALVERGAAVRAVDFEQPAVPGAECLAADAGNPDTCLDLGKGVDRIAHLGAFHGAHLEHNRGSKGEADFFSSNIASTFHFLRSAVENRAASFVWASSTVVYERGTWRVFGIYSLSKVVRVTLAVIENETIDFGMYDVQTPLPFTPADEWSYMQGNRVEVLAKYWPQHRSLLERHEQMLPPAINTVRMGRTLRDLGVRIEHDFGWFLDELAERDAREP